VTTWVRGCSKAEKDLGDKARAYPCSNLVSQPPRTNPRDLKSGYINDHSPPEYYVDRDMRALTRGISKISTCMTTLPQADPTVINGISTHNRALELSLEPLKVTDISLDQRLLTGWSEVLPHFIWRRESAITEGVTDLGLHGVVPLDPVGDGIGNFEVVRKGTSANLEIAIRVAHPPSPLFGESLKMVALGKLGLASTIQNRTST